MEDRTDGAVTPGDVGGAEKARKGQTGIGVPWAEVSTPQQIAAQHSSTVVAQKGQEEGEAANHIDSGELQAICYQSFTWASMPEPPAEYPRVANRGGTAAVSY
jgi:hypothetical protein